MKSKILLFGALMYSVTIARAQDSKRFDGLYVGFVVGAQNIFSGALIDEIDVLKNQNRFTTDFSVGFRKQIAKERILVGAELRVGLIDGKMNRQYNNGFQDIQISYETNIQSGFGINLGAVLGEKKTWLVNTYLFEVNRTFDIIWVEQNGTIHNQEDGNSYVRYGLTVERTLSNRINCHLSFGNIHVDFGDANTTESVNDTVEWMLGLNYQF